MKTKTTILFDIGLILKGIDSLLEVAGGVLLLSPVRLSQFLEDLSQHSKHDFIARNLDKLSTSAHAVTIATAVYLMVHGLAKAILIVAALKRKTWGYIGLMGVLTFFSIVEMVRFLEVLRPVTLILSLFDAALVLLIAHEYQERYKKPKAPTISSAEPDVPA